MDNIIASIIVPVYKAEETIEKCLDSLLDQTVDNYEVIVVDDGSPDRCGEICDRYACDKIRVIHQKNAGVPAARNAALDVAQGKYLLFCDSDDYVDRNFVKTFCDKLDENQYEMIVSSFDSYNTVNNRLDYKMSYETFAQPIVVERKNFLELRRMDFMAALWNKAFKTSIVKENNIRFLDALQSGQDLGFILEYLKCMKTDICVIPDVLYHYLYQQKDNVAAKYRSDSFFGKYKILFTKYQEAFDAIGMLDNENIKSFYTDYFLTFIKCLQNTWDKRNEFGFFKKLIYNHKIVTSQEYKKCFDNMDKSRFTPIYLTVAKLRCALLILAFLKLAK